MHCTYFRLLQVYCNPFSLEQTFVISVEDNVLTPDGFGEIAATLKNINCKQLTFCRCDLTAQKLMKFSDGCLETGTTVSEK